MMSRSVQLTVVADPTAYVGRIVRALEAADWTTYLAGQAEAARVDLEQLLDAAWERYGWVRPW